MTQAKIQKIADIDGLTYEQLRIEFMRMSPTYQLINEWIDAPTSIEVIYLKRAEKLILASRSKTNKKNVQIKLNQRELANLAKMYEAAEETYLEYGDINKPYEKWWTERGYLVFDSSSNVASVRDLGTIDSSNIKKSLPAVKSNIASLSNSRDSRHHIILSVPMYMLHKDAVVQVSQLLDGQLFTSVKQKRLRKQPLGQRHRYKPLLTKLKMLMYRCFNPTEPLLDLGMRLNISPTNKRIMDNQHGTFSAEEVAAARRRFILATSRALNAAMAIAECSSRDKFPRSARSFSLDFDWSLNKKNLLKAWPNLKG